MGTKRGLLLVLIQLGTSTPAASKAPPSAARVAWRVSGGGTGLRGGVGVGVGFGNWVGVEVGLGVWIAAQVRVKNGSGRRIGSILGCRLGLGLQGSELTAGLVWGLDDLRDDEGAAIRPHAVDIHVFEWGLGFE